MTDLTPDTPDTAVETVVGEVVDDESPPMRFSEREWPQPWMGQFLDAMALMPVVAAAARTASISRGYAYEAARRWPVFAEGWREAYEQGVEVLEQHVHRWATVGVQVVDTETRTVTDPDGKVTQTVVESRRTSVSPSLAMFVLKRHRNAYREHTHVEHTLPPPSYAEGVDPHEVERKPTRERIRELARIAQQLHEDDEAQ